MQILANFFYNMNFTYHHIRYFIKKNEEYLFIKNTIFINKYN